MRTSNWYSFSVCQDCENRLSSDEKMYSGGTCPHCGNTNDSTIVDCIKVTIRSHNPNPWWKLFNRLPITYEGRDQYSKDWLK